MLCNTLIVGTEHLLLALLREREAISCTVLQWLTIEKVREQVLALHAEAITPDLQPFSPPKSLSLFTFPEHPALSYLKDEKGGLRWLCPAPNRTG